MGKTRKEEIELRKLFLIVFAMSVTVAAANAGSVLNVASLQNVGTITAGSVEISFNPMAPTANFNLGGGNTGIFNGVTGTGSIENFQNLVTASESGFLTLSALPAFSIDLVSLDAASGAALGPVISLLQIAPTLVSATIGGSGTATDGTNNYSVTFVLSTQQGGTVAGVQSSGLTNDTWSGFFDLEPITTTPEPGTWGMIVTGLLIVGFGKIRKHA